MSVENNVFQSFWLYEDHAKTWFLHRPGIMQKQLNSVRRVAKRMREHIKERNAQKATTGLPRPLITQILTKECLRMYQRFFLCLEEFVDDMFYVILEREEDS